MRPVGCCDYYYYWDAVTRAEAAGPLPITPGLGVIAAGVSDDVSSWRLGTDAGHVTLL